MGKSIKFKTITDKDKFDESNIPADSIIRYPTIKQLIFGNRVVSIYSLLGDHGDYKLGVIIFDAKTGKNQIALWYFPDEESILRRVKRHFAQNEKPDIYRFTCHGETCCDGTPILIEAHSPQEAKRKSGLHWWGKDDFVIVR